MPLLRTYTTAFDPDDIADGEIPRDDVTEDTIDCTPDNWDLDDDVTAVMKAVEALQDAGLTEPSCSPVSLQSCSHLWFSLVDGSQPSGWDGHYTGRLEEVSAHPEGFTPEEVYAICVGIGARVSNS